MFRQAMGKVHFSLIVAFILMGTALLLLSPLHSDKAAQAGSAGAARHANAAHSSNSAAALQTDRNLGKAYYEQGDYLKAIAQFQEVIASGKALATDHMDLGMALVQANRLNEALGEITTAKQMDPHLVAAEYNLGIVYKRELRYPEAEAAFNRVIQSDPNDPATWFNLGSVYFAQRKLDQALAAEQHVVKMGFVRGQNFYVAALFHVFTILSRLKRRQEAQAVLKIHEQVRNKVPGISLQIPALEGGKYGAIVVPRVAPAFPSESAGMRSVTFSDITSQLGIASIFPKTTREIDAKKEIKASEYSLDFARRQLLPLFGESVAIGDYDGDAQPDIYVVNPAGKNHLFHNNGNGTFSDVTEKAGVAGLSGSLFATFADYNNSSHPSLFVVGLGGVHLFHNNGNGTFTDVTQKAGLKGSPGDLDTRAVLFDADNDGFLDLILTTYTDLNSPPRKHSFVFPGDFAGASVHFYRNNGDGTFTDETRAAGLATAKGRWRGASFSDFNNDGYMDLLLTRDNGSPLLYLNQGDDHFIDRTSAAGPALARSLALQAQTADFNHDGNFDICLWTQRGYKVLINRGDARFEPVTRLPVVTPPTNVFDFRGTVADLNGDGFDDLLVAGAGGRLHFIANRLGHFEEGKVTLPAKANVPLATVTSHRLRNPAKIDILAITRKGQLLALQNHGSPTRWVEVKLGGYKSNTEGVGSTIELKAGDFYDKVMARGGTTRVFTGNLPKLDVVRVTWPNQIVQNEINVATDQSVKVRESERLASSCPLLYVWNGKQFKFFTDVLGDAPLGELAPDGSRLKPDPQELVRLPEKLPLLKGHYVFQITDELREVDYLDQARLLAVDHPASEEIYANEIYSSSPTRPRLFVVRHKRFPESAVDTRGHNVLPLILKADGRYPASFRQDRILGMAALHSLTLNLGDFPNTDHISLWLNGWVFWTDSNGSRALLRNHRLKMVSPYLQVRDQDGRWRTVIPDMGLPSGTNRTMRVDLTGKFLSSDHHVRIVTNLCVYWDQIFFTAEAGPLRLGSRPRELPLFSADLHYRGFSTPSSDPQHRRPDDFDYAQLLVNAPWSPMHGYYTRYGAVKTLLNAADDHLVVLATGDELTLRFSASDLPPLRPGWKRSFFLYLAGWAKDGEPNTAYPHTVNPLPFHAMSNYPPSAQEPAPHGPAYRHYLQEFQTRPGYWLIPPLAPATKDSAAGGN